MVEPAVILCPESQNEFEKISLLNRTVTCHVELIDKDLARKLNQKAGSFTLSYINYIYIVLGNGQK